MVRLAAQAEAGPPAPAAAPAGPPAGPRPAGAGAPAPAPAADNPRIGAAPVSDASNTSSRAQAALEAIAGYIPSEALALYIAALGTFQPSTDTAKWVVLGLGVVLVIVFAGWSALDRATRPATDKIVIVTVLAIISFVTYAAALPGSPFLSIHAQATAAAGFVAILLSLVLPKIATTAKVAPQA
jgi:hypothetical protein